MNILIGIPHVFRPQDGSVLSSQTEAKRALKAAALQQVTHGNLDLLRGQQVQHRYHQRRWVALEQACEGHQVQLQLHVIEPWHLLEALGPAGTWPAELRLLRHQLADPTDLALAVSRSLLAQAAAEPSWDLVVYLEDDIVLLDCDLPDKVLQLVQQAGEDYAFMPHRCEHLPGVGDVVLASEPTEPRPDLFWATGEMLELAWLGSSKRFARVVNPHAGCYLLTQAQAARAHGYWQARQWQIDYHWAGKLEMACTGIFLPIFRLMKIAPEQARHFQVRHLDCLWQGIPRG